MIQTIQTNHKRGLWWRVTAPRVSVGRTSALKRRTAVDRCRCIRAIQACEGASDRYAERGDLNVRYGAALANVSRWPESAGLIIGAFDDKADVAVSEVTVQQPTLIDLLNATAVNSDQQNQEHQISQHSLVCR